VQIFNAITCGFNTTNTNFTGRIHSVFTTACNIQTLNRRLITLLVHSKPDQPCGIRLATPKNFKFSDWIKSGHRVFCQEGYLQIEEPDFLINMRLARIWRRALPIYSYRISDTHLINQYQNVVQLLLSITEKKKADEKQPRSKILDAQFLPTLYSLSKKLTLSARINDRPKTASTILSLIGLGPGLTPWGDDFLCGFMAGFECFAENIEKKETLDWLRQVLTNNLDATSDISKSILNDAILSQHGELVVETCQAMIDPKRSKKLTTQLHQLIGVGVTSGTASCLGILSGIAAATDKKELYETNFLYLISNLIEGNPEK